MKRRLIYSLVVAVLAGSFGSSADSGSTPPPAPAPNGIAMPTGYTNWRLISASHRADNKTLRVILGNDTAIEAARAGKTNPWPDGSILAKLVWKNAEHQDWPEATVPGDFVHAEFMLKDSRKYASTSGWGWARWLGREQKPFGNDENFTQSCLDCHEPVKENDWVFTHPAQLP